METGANAAEQQRRFSLAELLVSPPVFIVNIRRLKGERGRRSLIVVEVTAALWQCDVLKGPRKNFLGSGFAPVNGLEFAQD